MAVDRAATRRKDPQWVRELLEAPSSRVVAVSRDGVLLDDGAEPALARRPLALVGGSEQLTREPILLGLEDGSAMFALDLEELDGSLTTVSLREAGSLLPAGDGGLAAYAVALLGWHRRHRFCANCGAPTDVSEAGFSRHCPNCGATHFPRLDPVVIMLVEHDGRLLLGRHTNWPPRRYSALAGFVAPGESVEEAVVREVHEESGIRAFGPQFVASQPWPFPSSLMLGFHAYADGGEPFTRDGELEDVRWFEQDAVRAALTADAGGPGTGRLLLPPPIAIARFLIDRWLTRS
jgi:NAD+ diphosphatase